MTGSCLWEEELALMSFPPCRNEVEHLNAQVDSWWHKIQRPCSNRISCLRCSTSSCFGRGVAEKSGRVYKRTLFAMLYAIRHLRAWHPTIRVFPSGEGKAVEGGEREGGEKGKRGRTGR